MLTAYQISGDSRAGDEGGENALKQFLIQPSEDPCPPRWFRLRLKLHWLGWRRRQFFKIFKALPQRPPFALPNRPPISPLRNLRPQFGMPDRFPRIAEIVFAAKPDCLGQQPLELALCFVVALLLFFDVGVHKSRNVQAIVLRITGFPFVRRLQIGLRGGRQLLNKLVLGIHLEPC